MKHKYSSADGSVRYLFGLPAPEEQIRMKSASVEAVFMPSERRQTICISTQAGCAVDCQFCLTAQLGLIRNLTPGEILAQVLLPLIEMGGANAGGEVAPIERIRWRRCLSGTHQCRADGSRRAAPEF